MTEESKDRWKRVLTKEFMSSEDSGTEILEDGSERNIMYVRRLPWRSVEVTTGLHCLDDKINKRKTKLATRQTLIRKEGDVSDRPKPIASGFAPNFWGFVNN